MSEQAPGKLRITEIYSSVQGESSWAGYPCVFVRLTGCPLRCVWCDTAYAFTGGEEWTVGDAVRKVKSFGLPLVEVTGGEPLAQKNSTRLMDDLLREGFQVLLETSGAFDLDAVPLGVHRIVDVKCPGSGEERKNLWGNLSKLTGLDEVKFVIRDEVDYDYAKDVVGRYGLAGSCGLLFSPVQGVMDPAKLADWMRRDKLRVRLNLQLHKVIWPKDTKGK